VQGDVATSRPANANRHLPSSQHPPIRHIQDYVGCKTQAMQDTGNARHRQCKTLACWMRDTGMLDARHWLSWTQPILHATHRHRSDTHLVSHHIDIGQTRHRSDTRCRILPGKTAMLRVASQHCGLRQTQHTHIGDARCSDTPQATSQALPHRMPATLMLPLQHLLKLHCSTA